MNDKLEAYSIREVATMLHLPTSTLHYYCHNGMLPVFKIGRHYRILRSDLLEFIQTLKDTSTVL